LPAGRPPSVQRRVRLEPHVAALFDSMGIDLSRFDNALGEIILAYTLAEAKKTEIDWEQAIEDLGQRRAQERHRKAVN